MSLLRVLVELRQVVRDLEPGCFRADEDVLRRPNAGSVDKRSHRHVYVGTVTHHGKEERATCPAPRVVQVLLSEDQQAIQAVRDLELFPLYARKRLERRTGRSATARAVAVRRVEERILDAVTDQAALALSGEHTIAFGRHDPNNLPTAGSADVCGKPTLPRPLEKRPRRQPRSQFPSDWAAWHAGSAMSKVEAIQYGDR